MQYNQTTLIEKYLISQKELSYPDFREAISSILQIEFKLCEKEAVQLVWSNTLTDEITKDINWAQHMGPSCWADFLINNNKYSGS